MNERALANGFSALWAEYFPMLSPTFIIAFNESHVRPIFGRDGIVPRVNSAVGSHRPDVLAEFGFRIAAAAHEAGTSVKIAARNQSLLTAAHVAAVSRVRELRAHHDRSELNLNQAEQEEGVRLAAVYEQFLTLWPADAKVTFLPRVQGCGVLNACSADLSIGSTLYEVKTVSRRFQSRDLRQLLVYVALQAMTEQKRWDYGGLLNPRAGVFCQFSIDWLVTRLSGGRPPKIVLSDFMQALSRESVIDRQF